MFKWTSFGKVKFGEEIFDCDVYVIEGQASPRSGYARETYGTNHVIDAEELRHLVKEDTEALVIGNGQNGVAKLSDDAEEFIDSRHIEIHVMETPEAIKKYNEICGEVKTVALIHVTC